jgi:predicted RNA binding protein YcfA (HicA-like mRNA interferase family)
MNSKEIIKTLESNGWLLKRINGSHYHFIYPIQKGIVTVPYPKKDLPVGTVRSIEKQANIKLKV